MVDVPRLILACALLLVAASAFAVEEDCSALPGPNPPTSTPHVYETMGTPGFGCSNTSGGGTTGTQFADLGTAQAAFQARVAMCGGSGCSLSTLTFCGTNGSGEDIYDQRLTTIPGGTPKHQAFKIKADASDGTTCEVPEDDCASLAGTEAQGFADNKDEDTYEPPDTTCIPVPGIGSCDSYRRGKLNDGMTKCIPGTDLGCDPVPYSRNSNGDGTASFMWRSAFTGMSCTPPQDDVEELVVEGEQCNGDYCEGVQARPGCGYLNGEYICTPMNEGGCTVYADGSRNCEGHAPTPPVPDNGTPGVPAEPDASVDSCTGNDSCQTINNYNSTTVGGSSRDPGAGDGSGSGPGSGSGNDGSGNGSGNGDGDGEGDDPTADDSASGGVSCDEPPVCDGDPIACAVLDQQWRTRCVDDAGLVAEISDAAGFTEGELGGDLSGGAEGTDIGEFESAGPLTGGSCPSPFNITVWGTSISIDVWEYGCDMATLFAPFVLAMGYLIAGLMLIRGI